MNNPYLMLPATALFAAVCFKFFAVIAQIVLITFFLLCGALVIFCYNRALAHSPSPSNTINPPIRDGRFAWDEAGKGTLIAYERD